MTPGAREAAGFRAPPALLGGIDRNHVFWLCIGLLAVARLALTSDLSTQIHYSPIDDTLFVERAYALLTAGDFGAYDARLLSKYPGLSIWMAGLRMLGLPLLVTTNLLYIGAGIYVVTALLRQGLPRIVLALSLALYLFDPVTLGYEWIRPQREPLVTVLFVGLLGAWCHMLLALRDARPTWPHLIVFSMFFAFSLFVREDDRFLWLLCLLACGSIVWRSVAGRTQPRRPALACAAVLLPLSAGLIYEHALRNFVEEKYGSRIFHEMSEGEFPRLMGAIRSVDTVPDNRLVALTQDAATRIAAHAPSLRPVLDRLPRPGPGTYSCIYQGICSEWSNGYLPFWIKEEAQRAGMTPTLPQAQAYFRKAREEIEAACAAGLLKCTPRGDGMFPPFELRWTRAYVAEAWTILRTAPRPSNNPIERVPVSFEIPLQTGRVYQAVTMAHHFDTLWQSSATGRPVARPYPLDFGLLRQKFSAVAYPVSALLIALCALAWAWRIWWMEWLAASPLATVGILLGAYWFAKFLALAYVATFMGGFAERIWFPFHASSVLLGLPFVIDAMRAWCNRPGGVAA